MPVSDNTAERILESGDLRVRFVWLGDRYGHEVLVRRGEPWYLAASSEEGTPMEAWPASPPFQSLHIEDREDGRTLALLVGMAGKSHWSASIEIENRAGEPACVSFDVACRVRAGEAGPLGSTYRLQNGAGGTLKLELGGRFGPAKLETTGERNAVIAEMAAREEAQTVRWDYRLVLAN
jgi:hypothetical protein